jgi:CysZ protein
MIGTALLRAVLALSMPELRQVVASALGLSLLGLALLWAGVATVLADTVLFGWPLLDWLVDLAGGVAMLALSWVLFAPVATFVMSFFLDRVAATVEARDYPGVVPSRPPPWRRFAGSALRLGLLSLVLNLLALPLYAFVPGINAVLFLALNGYLFGRGYFEAVALRSLDATAVKLLRRRFAGRIFLGGVAITGLFWVPLLNLVAPVVATAFMVHVFQALPRAAPLPVGSAA